MLMLPAINNPSGDAEENFFCKKIAAITALRFTEFLLSFGKRETKSIKEHVCQIQNRRSTGLITDH